MEYSKLLDLVSDLGYDLAMSGAETFRVEESIRRVLAAYEVEAEVFVIPNCMHISIEPVAGRPLTRMRRIGTHDNDLDAVERFSGLSRRLCAEHPAPEIAAQWLREVRMQRRYYPLPVYLLGHFFAAAGFALFFGGSLRDFFCSGLCGVVIGLLTKYFGRMQTNSFFCTMVNAFAMTFSAYALRALGLADNVDYVAIGALMLLVPGLLITNAMRDITYGDTNSGTNRLVQVLLIAAAIALGSTTAAGVFVSLFGPLPAATVPPCGIMIQAIGCLLGCMGFSFLFNIHGTGIWLCILGGMLSWIGYTVTLQLCGNDIAASFAGALLAAVYAEALARIRKYPAISYLVVAIFPLIPGAGVYYTMDQAMNGNMDAFASRGIHTAAIAGIIAVGILLISTAVRFITIRRK